MAHRLRNGGVVSPDSHRGRVRAAQGALGVTDAHLAGCLPEGLARLRRYGLIIVDEVGYPPFEQDAANLFVQLVSSRYEHASLTPLRVSSF